MSDHRCVFFAFLCDAAWNDVQTFPDIFFQSTNIYSLGSLSVVYELKPYATSLPRCCCQKIFILFFDSRPSNDCAFETVFKTTSSIVKVVIVQKLRIKWDSAYAKLTYSLRCHGKFLLSSASTPDCRPAAWSAAAFVQKFSSTWPLSSSSNFLWPRIRSYAYCITTWLWIRP